MSRDVGRRVARMAESDRVPVDRAAASVGLRMRRILRSAMTVLIAGCQPALPTQPPPPSPVETCLAANQKLSLGALLPRVSARLNSGQPLTIVALGSSSTVGLWVLNSAATYPEVMKRELLRLRPQASVVVINSGR